MEYLALTSTIMSPIARKYFLKLAAGHLIVAAAGVYAQLWALGRIIPALNVDPEIYEELVSRRKKTEFISEEIVERKEMSKFQLWSQYIKSWMDDKIGPSDGYS